MTRLRGIAAPGWGSSEACLMDAYKYKRPNSAKEYLKPEIFAERFSKAGDGITNIRWKMVQKYWRVVKRMASECMSGLLATGEAVR